MKARHEYVAVAERELLSWPDVTATFEDGGKHCRILLRFRGAERFVVFAATPSDSVHGALNFLGDMRANLRAIGATRAERRKSTRERTRHRAPPRHAELPTISDPRPDGFAALRQMQAHMEQEAASTVLRPPARPWLLGLLQSFARLARGGMGA